MIYLAFFIGVIVGAVIGPFVRPLFVRMLMSPDKQITEDQIEKYLEKKYHQSSSHSVHASHNSGGQLKRGYFGSS